MDTRLKKYSANVTDFFECRSSGYVEGFSRFFVFGIDMKLFLNGYIPNALSTFGSNLKEGFLIYPA